MKKELIKFGEGLIEKVNARKVGRFIGEVANVGLTLSPISAGTAIAVATDIPEVAFFGGLITIGGWLPKHA